MESVLRSGSFVVAVLGVSILVVLLIFPGGEFRDLESLRDNEKVVFSGRVEGERISGNFKILRLVGKDFDVVCSCEGSGSFLGDEVEIEGLVDEFREEKQVRVLKIKIL